LSTPNLTELTGVEAEILAARLKAVRFSITHPGEKGRDLEFHVRHLLRDLLPAEYGLTTGFVAYVENDAVKLTSQLDIIIYDAVRGSPLVRLESCDVLPLEAVYGYVEVKSTLRSSQAKELPHDSIEAIVKNNAFIRTLRTRAYFTPMSGSPSAIGRLAGAWRALRAYVVAFEADGSIAQTPDKFAKGLANVLLEEKGAHLHGVMVLESGGPGGFYYTKPVFTTDDEAPLVKYTTDNTLLAFKSIVLQGLSTFPRPEVGWFADLDQYLKHSGQWREQSAT
jgi:hypothetical protein